jgi:Protein of unknown function (DUF3795)
MEKDFARIAPCGIDCVNCELFADVITAEMKTRMAGALRLDPEKAPCRGCRVEKGCRLLYSFCLRWKPEPVEEVGSSPAAHFPETPGRSSASGKGAPLQERTVSEHRNLA